MDVSIIIRREITPENWARVRENKGKVGIIQYALSCNSPMSYHNYITPLGARSIILTPVAKPHMPAQGYYINHQDRFAYVGVSCSYEQGPKQKA